MSGKSLPLMHEGLSRIHGTARWQEERADCTDMSSDLYLCAVEQVPTHTYNAHMLIVIIKNEKTYRHPVNPEF